MDVQTQQQCMARLKHLQKVMLSMNDEINVLVEIIDGASSGSQAEQSTVEVKKPVLSKTYLQQLIGDEDSLLGTYLSKEVLEYGKGNIEPKLPHIRRFIDDISNILPEKLIHFETGFYRNRENKAAQFFIDAGPIKAYVDMLPSPTTIVLFSYTNAVMKEIPISEINEIIFRNLMGYLGRELKRVAVTLT